ncbi:MAG: alpha/beta hydrolase [Candidatus Lokiarchaeota archaeon]|nr:alpha/beta hydrolase [Candidatus Lokiarchaeota archaeon]
MTEEDLLNQLYVLEDGRKIGYAEYGDVAGKPIFYFHGHGSSRLEPKIYDIEEIENQVRIIAVDRPGFGLSDFTLDHSILSWSSDIIELANSLKIDRFSVLGGSGGAPFALACAYKNPERIVTCGIVSGLGPIELGIEGMAKNNRRELELAQKNPNRLKLLFKLQAKLSKKLVEKDIEVILKKFRKRGKNLPEPDKKIFEDKEKLRMYVSLMTEPFRQGIMGPFHEAQLYVKPWNFKLTDISPDIKVYLWHGDLDTSVPKKMAQSVCQKIPNCEAKFYVDEAHLSTALNHIKEILMRLI